MKKDIKSMDLKEIKTEIDSLSEKKFRADQIFKWLRKGAGDFDEMSNLPVDLRDKLREIYYIPVIKIEEKYCSKKDETVKYLIRLDDDYVESVLMKYKHGYSVCVSTQVGCKMGCTFCATGKSGFLRNLSPAEIEGQIRVITDDIGERISNVVLMGMGEPLDNYDNVLRFLELVASEDGLNIGMRHISLSTCGIVDKIYDLADKKMQITLSVSIHAQNDAIRNKTMPINKKWNMDELLKACKYYTDKTNRRISFEYAMIDGVNDSQECAKELSRRLKGIIAHVNLIPVNSTEGNSYIKSSKDALHRFPVIIEQRGCSATIRRTMGADIEASCGQLRRRYMGEESQ